MDDSFDKQLDFVVKYYDEGIYDPASLIGHNKATYRWWVVVVSAIAGVAVAFAAGYGIVTLVHESNHISNEMPEASEEKQHLFVFDNCIFVI